MSLRLVAVEVLLLRLCLLLLLQLLMAMVLVLLLVLLRLRLLMKMMEVLRRRLLEQRAANSGKETSPDSDNPHLWYAVSAPCFHACTWGKPKPQRSPSSRNACGRRRRWRRRAL